MMSVHDQFNDPAFGVLYRQIGRMPALENYVKTAEVNTAEAGTLPDTAFAWPDERRFPVHTAEHAALSYAYSKTASFLPTHVESRIKAALTVYGIPDEVFLEQTKVASEDKPEDYLLPDLRRLPVRTAGEVKLAENRLLGSLTKLDLEHRAIACGNLVKKAAEFNVELHPEVLKLAGFVVSSSKIARDWLEARASALPESDRLFKVAYQTLADELKKQPAETKDRDSLLKLASVVAELDEKSGLDKHYDRKLPDAMRTVFNTEKRASESIDIAGSMISLNKLAALPDSFWEDLGGSELLNEISPGGVMNRGKLASILETLPLDLKVILKSQMQG